MGKKLNRVYQALLDGAIDGLSDQALYSYVQEECPKTSSKRIVKASLLALTDPEVKSKRVLDVVYALAIKYRLESLGVEEDHDEDDETTAAPSVTEETKSKLSASTSPVSLSKDVALPQEPAPGGESLH